MMTKVSELTLHRLPTSNPCRAPEGRDRNLIRRREGEMAVWRRLFRFAVCNLYQDQQSIRTNCGLRGRKVTSGLPMRSEEHTSELQSLMRISYAVFCLKKKIQQTKYSVYMEHRK